MLYFSDTRHTCCFFRYKKLISDCNNFIADRKHFKERWNKKNQLCHRNLNSLIGNKRTKTLDSNTFAPLVPSSPRGLSTNCLYLYALNWLLQTDSKSIKNLCLYNYQWIIPFTNNIRTRVFNFHARRHRPNQLICLQFLYISIPVLQLWILKPVNLLICWHAHQEYPLNLQYEFNYSLSNYGQIVGQLGYFNHGMATGLSKGKLWMQAC